MKNRQMSLNMTGQPIEKPPDKTKKRFDAGDIAEWLTRKDQDAEDISISSNDPKAITKLEAKLGRMETKLNAIKTHNKTPGTSKSERWPTYILTNLGANIRTVIKRIEYLRALANDHERTIA